MKRTVIQLFLLSPTGIFGEAVKTIRAVYENGVLRPLEKVELPERTEVEFEPRPIASQPPDANMDRIYGILGERYKSGESNVAERHNEHQLKGTSAFRT